jgi:hypothetical protein
MSIISLCLCLYGFETEINNCFCFSCGPDEHVAMVDKLQKSLKAANKVSFCYLKFLILHAIYPREKGNVLLFVLLNVSFLLTSLNSCVVPRKHSIYS